MVLLYDIGFSPVTEEETARIRAVLKHQRMKHALDMGWIQATDEGLGTEPCQMPQKRTLGA